MNPSTKTVGAFDAKTHLSQYLDEVAQGHCIEITRRGKPVAFLVPSDSVYPKEADIDQVIQRVRERRTGYKVSQNEIQEWKAEGRA